MDTRLQPGFVGIETAGTLPNVAKEQRVPRAARLNVTRTGLIVGAFSAVWHATWCTLVATGAAQTVLDWIYKLHFLNNPFRVAEFNIVTASLLVLVTFSVACIAGCVFALLWNALHRE
jgi:hypothetical protein